MRRIGVLISGELPVSEDAHQEDPENRETGADTYKEVTDGLGISPS